MSKYYKIVTYGCQMNIHESEKLAGILLQKGFLPTDEEKNADIIVFNTCCIRDNAEKHFLGNLGAVKKLKEKNKGLIVAVGGCMTQQQGLVEEFIKKYPFVDIVFGTHNLEDFGNFLDLREKNGKRVVEIPQKEEPFKEAVKPMRTSYPNAWVNIMHGCNNFCTYCIVPYVRGRERSRLPDKIFSEVNLLVGSGYKEITLLGQNVNSYGKDLPTITTFAELIDKIAIIKGNFRLRFMTNHPKDLTEEMVLAMARNENVCHQVHLPVQSGSDRILKLMNRRYTVEDYLKKVEILRKAMPDIAISTDIMVGFPSETEEDFLMTLDLCKKVGFSSAFCFVYSRRRGTVADKMEEQISEAVKKDRIMRLLEVINGNMRETSAKYVGKTITILVEAKDEKSGLYLGRDEYGRMGYFKSDKNRIGEFVNLKIYEARGISLHGELEE